MVAVQEIPSAKSILTPAPTPYTNDASSGETLPAQPHGSTQADEERGAGGQADDRSDLFVWSNRSSPILLDAHAKQSSETSQCPASAEDFDIGDAPQTSQSLERTRKPVTVQCRSKRRRNVKDRSLEPLEYTNNESLVDIWVADEAPVRVHAAQDCGRM